jgi:hypothetical protein
MLLGTVPCDFKDFLWQLATNIRMMDALRQAQVINGNNLASSDAVLVAGNLCYPGLLFGHKQIFVHDEKISN